MSGRKPNHQVPLPADCKQVSGHPSYSVTRNGAVFSSKCSDPGFARLVRQQKTKNGYLRVCLTENAKPLWALVHRLVAQAFVENPTGRKYVNHKNCVKTDNHSENLEWVTSEENSRHAVMNGRYASRRGDSNSRTKISQTPISRISLGLSRSLVTGIIQKK